MTIAKASSERFALMALLGVAASVFCGPAGAQFAPLNDTHASSLALTPVNTGLRPPYPVGTKFTATCTAYSLADYNSVIDLTGGPFFFTASTTTGIVWTATSANAADDGNTVPISTTFAPSGVPEATGTVQVTQNVSGPVQYTCWYYGNIVGVEGNGTSNRVTINGPTLSSNGGGASINADVPFPLWGLGLLGLGLAGALSRSRQKQASQPEASA